MTEAEFQRQAEAECRRLGLLWHHCRDARHCSGPQGLPDLLALGPRGLILAELKGPDGETSAAQDRWIWTAHRLGMAIPVLRPADAGHLMELLRSIAAP